MSTFAEFVLVALLIYFWESTLWLPLRGVALRQRLSGKHWKTLDPGKLFATRELGLVPMIPFLPDAGLAPCQSPPLFIDRSGNCLIDTTDGRIVALGGIEWNQIEEQSHHLVAGDLKTRISSSRCVGALRRAKQRGATPAAAIRQAMRLALSPVRARREWNRWRLVSASLRVLGPMLTLGFFVGLPLVHLKLGGLHTLMLALWLWSLMVWTAGHLWWLGKRVYPDARSALRTDALLSLLVPFHAMRAMEIASVHAMGTTHPAALVLSSDDLECPWLGQFVRRTIYPLESDADFRNALRPFLDDALAGCGKTARDFDIPPDRARDPQAERFCPRCHGLYLATIATCPDCDDIVLIDFPPH